MKLHYFLAILLLWLTMNVHAKEEFIVGLTEQGLRTASPEEIELGFNTQLAKLNEDADLSLRLKIYKNDQNLVEALHKKKLQVYFGSPIMVFNHLNDFDLEHLYSPVLSGNVKHQYLLLVKKDSRIDQLKQLEHKTIAYTQSDHVGVEYLDHLIQREKRGTLKAFFNKLELVRNPNLVAMAVFFNKVEAGIMLDSDFDIAAELNPQLKTQLAILEKSPAYVTNVLAFINAEGIADSDRRRQYVMGNVKKVSKQIKLSNAYGFSQMRSISFEDLATVQLLMKNAKRVDH